MRFVYTRTIKTNSRVDESLVKYPLESPGHAIRVHPARTINTKYRCPTVYAKRDSVSNQGYQNDFLRPHPKEDSLSSDVPWGRGVSILDLAPKRDVCSKITIVKT